MSTATPPRLRRAEQGPLPEMAYTAEDLDRAVRRLVLAEEEYDTTKANAEFAKASFKEAQEELSLAQRAVTKVQRGLDGQTGD